MLSGLGGVILGGDSYIGRWLIRLNSRFLGEVFWVGLLFIFIYKYVFRNFVNLLY